jgi:acyl carrier protein
MTDHDILDQLTAVFRNVFEDPTITLRPETNADDIPEWDSMSQITLTVEIEHAFHMKIRSAEMEELQNVGELITLIRARAPVAAI